MARSQLYFDAGMSQAKNEVTYGLVLDGKEKFGLLEHADPMDGTANEVRALTAGLRWALDRGVSELDVIGDNMQAMWLVSGQREPDDEHLSTFVTMARIVLPRFQSVKWFWIASEANKADPVAKKGYSQHE